MTSEIATGVMSRSVNHGQATELLLHAAEQQVKLAFDMYTLPGQEIRRAYLAALGGAEAIVLGGGIGENTELIRERIFENMK